MHGGARAGPEFPKIFAKKVQVVFFFFKGLQAGRTPFFFLGSPKPFQVTSSPPSHPVTPKTPHGIERCRL
jgi:hypothetical protein